MNEKYKQFAQSIVDHQKELMVELKFLTDKGENLSHKERDFMNQLMDYIGYMNSTLGCLRHKVEREERWSS